jgi:threonine synthase
MAAASVATAYVIRCLGCGSIVEHDDGAPRCISCGGWLTFEFDLSRANPVDRDVDSMWRYRDVLPVPSGVPPVTIGEGLTPLIPARTDTGCTTWWKNEALNPTGSQKDRAMSVALTRARWRGVATVFVASAGSTALAAAAYAARGGIRCVVLVGEEASERRVLPIAALGARVLRVRGTVDDALRLLEEARSVAPIHDVSTTRAGNPAQGEGPKTIAWEIAETLGHAPDWIVVPTGGGGTLSAIHRGFRELMALGRVERIPRMASYQPIGYETFLPALEKDWSTDAALREHAYQTSPPTVQVKIAHTYAPDGAEALAAIRDSGGAAVAVSDEDAMAGVSIIASTDGMFVEPSSGGLVDAIRQLVRGRRILPQDEVVGIIGGSGFRELDTIASSSRVEAAFLPDGDPVGHLVSLA